MNYTNFKMEQMLTMLKPILNHCDKVGYVAARNTRRLNDALVEYFNFKQDLINKYGEVDKDADGNELPTISIKPTSKHFQEFLKEFDQIKDIEHDVDIMKLKYDEVVGILNGNEILQLEWMLEE